MCLHSSSHACAVHSQTHISCMLTHYPQLGFVGSAVQISLIRNESSRGYVLPTNTYALHLHMLNPYGASYSYKENEHNVDLLKNLNGHYEDFASWNVSGNTVLERFIDALNIPQVHLPQVQQQAVAAYQSMVQQYGAGFVYASGE